MLWSARGTQMHGAWGRYGVHDKIALRELDRAYHEYNNHGAMAYRLAIILDSLVA